ncbi:MAG: NAD-dependent epimerase/dehydratase family protein [Candidatus Woesearchaeota archaeon]
MDELKGKKVLVTGGNGFVGTHLVKRLRMLQAEVYAVDKSSSDEKVDALDIADHEKARDYLDRVKPNYILHLAAMMSKADNDRDTVIRVNYDATKNILDSYGSYDKFVYVSTSEFYYGNVPPFREDMKANPTTPYSESKLLCENYCNGLIAQGKPIVIVRPPIVYGPGQGLGMFIPTLVMTCLSNEEFRMTKGEQTRDFLFVDDLVDLLVQALTTEAVNGETINAATGRPVPLVDVVNEVRRLTQSKSNIQLGAIPYRDNEAMEYYHDISKARRLLNWSPRFSLEDGLKLTVESYKA